MDAFGTEKYATRAHEDALRRWKCAFCEIQHIGVPFSTGSHSSIFGHYAPSNFNLYFGHTLTTHVSKFENSFGPEKARFGSWINVLCHRRTSKTGKNHRFLDFWCPKQCIWIATHEKVDRNCCGHVLAAFAAVFNPGNILGAIPLFWLRKGPIFDQNPWIMAKWSACTS